MEQQRLAQQFALPHPAQIRQWVHEQERLRQELATARADLAKLLKEFDAWRENQAKQRPRFIEEIPGPRMPYTYLVKIPFTGGTSTSQTASVTIAADGAFVCTGLEAYWRITASGHALAGRHLPVSTLPYRIYSLGATVPSGNMDFAFKIMTGGSGRYWQSDWILGAVLSQGWSGRPNYTAISGWVERANTLSVEAAPEYAVPADAGGDVWFYFHGYQILAPINLGEQLGMVL